MFIPVIKLRAVQSQEHRIWTRGPWTSIDFSWGMALKFLEWRESLTHRGFFQWLVWAILVLFFIVGVFAELVKCWSTTIEMLLQFSYRRIRVGEGNKLNCNHWCSATGFSHFFSERLWILSVSRAIPVQEAQLEAGRSSVHLLRWPHSQKSWSEKSQFEGEAVSGWVLLWRCLFGSICSLSVR